MDSVRYHSFPVGMVDAMSAYTTRSYPRHSHDQFGIGVVDEGGHSSWSDRGQVEAGPGSLICCNPGEVTDGHAVGGRPRSWRILYLDPALMRALCDDVSHHAASDFAFVKPVFGSEHSRARFDAVFAHAIAQDARDDVQCDTALLQLVAVLHRHSTRGALRANGPVGSIKRAKDIIDADPAARLTLADLAIETGLSRFQVLRAFARALGLTPHAYILQRRLELARCLLRAGSGIADASARAGFFDQPHLTRCFVKQFGVTPRRYASRT